MTEALQDILNYMASEGWDVSITRRVDLLSVELAPPGDRFNDVIVEGNGNPYELIGRIVTIWHTWETTGRMSLPS
jgi:hypothetical protein